LPKTILNPPALFPSLEHGFSQAVVVTGGWTVFISGQTAWDAHKHIVGGQDLAAQTEQAMHNVTIAVEAAGGSLDDVVALRIYIAQSAMHDLAAIAAALKKWFPVDPPASTWLGVTSLARPEFLIEIEATAVMASAPPASSPSA
jgi:2-iminobutanoate/2-iminopropanoate deaminase